MAKTPLTVRNNNPLALRDPNAKMVDGHSWFPTPQLGFASNIRDLRGKITGSSGVMKAKYGANYNPSIYNIIQVWAPASDGNDPAKYASFVAKESGINMHRRLTEADLKKIIPPMVQMEGGTTATKYFTPAMIEMGILKPDGTPYKGDEDPGTPIDTSKTGDPSSATPPSPQGSAQPQQQQQKPQGSAGNQSGSGSGSKTDAQKKLDEHLAQAEQEAEEAKAEAEKAKEEVERLKEELKAEKDKAEQEKLQEELDAAEKDLEEKDKKAEEKEEEAKETKEEESEHKNEKELVSDLSGEKGLNAIKLLKILIAKAPLSEEKLAKLKLLLGKISQDQNDDENPYSDHGDIMYGDHHGDAYMPREQHMKFDQFVVKRVGKLLPGLEDKIENFIDSNYPNLTQDHYDHMFTKIVEKNYTHIFEQVKVNFEEVYGGNSYGGDGSMPHDYRPDMGDVFESQKDHLDHLLQKHGYKPNHNKGGHKGHQHDDMMDVYDAPEVDIPVDQQEII